MAKQKKNWARRTRGRPRTADVDRTDSGRISRAKPGPKDIGDVVLAYRKNQYGLTDEQAKDQKAETAFGRAFLRKQIELVHYQAAENYLKRYEAAMCAIKAPVGLKKAGAGGGGDVVTDDYVEWAIRAVTLYEVAKGWLDDIHLRSIVHHVVIDDNECGVESVPYLKQGLAYLARRMGIEVEIAA